MLKRLIIRMVLIVFGFISIIIGDGDATAAILLIPLGFITINTKDIFEPIEYNEDEWV